MTTLPDVLKQLEDVKKEASELRNFTITFLSMLLYINLIIAGTTAEQILRIAPVNLPFLNVPLPIIGFYGFVPWLLLLFHLYLLIQHYLFSQQLFLFEDKLNDASVADEIRAHIHKNLGNLPFLHWMIGKHHAAMQFVLTLITLVCLIVWPIVTLLWLQMAIMPYHSTDLIWWQRVTILLDVLLIAWLWAKTLDKNDSSTAWWWAGMSGVGTALIFLPRCLIWLVTRVPMPSLVALLPSRWRTALPGFIVHPTNLWHDFKNALPQAGNSLALLLGLCVTLFLSLAVATLPDSKEERWLLSNTYKSWLVGVGQDVKVNGIYIDMTTRKAFVLTAWLHEQHPKKFELPTQQEEFDEWKAKGAKNCLVEKKADNNQSPDPDNKKADDTAAESKTEECLMVQPPLPRNLILREKMLTADSNLKPELEAKLVAALAKANSNVEANTQLAELLAQIRGLDLQDRNFDYADFSTSYLPEADLRYASLKYAVFINTYLNQARLDSSKLSGALLEHTNLSGAHLEHANLSDAHLKNTNLSSTRLEHANLSGSDLKSVNLSGAYLKYANLSGANILFFLHLSDAYLEYANLSGLDLGHIKLSGKRLENVNLSGTRLEHADLSGSDLKNANLSGAYLGHANLSGSDFKNTNLSGARLENANLSGVDLKNANLSGARLENTNLSGAELLISTKPWSQQELAELTDLYRKALLSSNSIATANVRAKDFEQRIQQPADFSKVAKIKPCLRASNTEQLFPDCVDENKLDDATRQDLAKVWLKLACEDVTEKHWIAQRMIERAKNYTWFASELLKAAQDPNCTGLADLSAQDKKDLQAKADEYAKPSAATQQ
jgi:uncharacterized protein YjbI with pentapeptide repeats